MPNLVIAPGGKPGIAGESFEISLSHCTARVMCSITEGVSGVDIQDTVLNFDEIAHNVLTEEEIAYIESQTDRNESFTDIWTRKECYGKYSGECYSFSICADLPQKLNSVN